MVGLSRAFPCVEAALISFSKLLLDLRLLSSFLVVVFGATLKFDLPALASPGPDASSGVAATVKAVVITSYTPPVRPVYTLIWEVGVAF